MSIDDLEFVYQSCIEVASPNSSMEGKLLFTYLENEQIMEEHEIENLNFSAENSFQVNINPFQL